MLYNYQKFLIVKFLELYSFYSLRSVLVLIFVISLGLKDSTAFLMYTNFVVGGDIISILGAYFGDRLLTRHISWFMGAIISILGYGYAFLNFELDGITLGLMFAGIGLGLCRCNSNVIINDYIQHEIQPQERHNHNGIFHVVTIVTLFVGFIVNGFVLKYLEPKIVFLFSASSIASGLGVFLFLEYKNLMSDLIIVFKNNLRKIFYVFCIIIIAFAFSKLLYAFKESVQVLILVCVCFSIIFLLNLSYRYMPRERQSILSLLLYVPFYLIYLSFEKQLDMGFSLFLFRNVNKDIFGYQIPSSMITSIFSVSILIASFVFVKKSVYSHLKHHNTLILGLLCSLLYFGVNYIGCLFNFSGIVNIGYPVLSLIFLGFADVIIVPRMYSLCRNAPNNIKSTASSLMMLSHGSGFYIAGRLAKIFTIDHDASLSMTRDLLIYQQGFLELMSISFIVLIAIFVLSKTSYGALLLRK